jgi:hypothetical protein
MKRLICLVVVLLFALVLPARAEPLPPPVVAIQFYDGASGVYLYGYPVMQRFGVPGMAMVPPDLMGIGRHMTVAQLQTMRTSGWQVCYHDRMAYDLPKLSDDALWARVSSMWNVLHDAGLEPTCAAPYVFRAGPREVTALQLAGYETIISTTDPVLPAPYSSYTLQSAHDAIPWRMVQAAITRIKSRPGEILILGFHDVTNKTPVDLQASQGRLTAVLEAVSAAGLSVVTFQSLEQ